MQPCKVQNPDFSQIHGQMGKDQELKTEKGIQHPYKKPTRAGSTNSDKISTFSKNPYSHNLSFCLSPLFYISLKIEQQNSRKSPADWFSA